MSVDSDAAFTNTDGVAFPGNAAVNASGPSATDGTEFVKIMIDNYMFGPMQAMLDRTGQTPTGVTEAAGLSQFIDGLDLMCNAPGIPTEWNLASDPAVTDHRCLFLQGQGILHANYPDLLAAVYVGDGNNAAVAAGGGFYYKATDAAGTIPNIAGTYLILPDRRGVVARGLDAAASIDPDGASRFLGDVQADAMQRITGAITTGIHGGVATPLLGGQAGVFTVGPAAVANLANSATPTNMADGALFDNSTSVSPNAAKTDDVESRMYNASTHYVIWY